MNQEHLILEESAQCFSCASGVISVNVTLQASQGAQGRERTGHCTYSLFSRSKTHQAQCCKASYTPGANQNKLSEHLTRSVGVCRADLILPCVGPREWRTLSSIHEPAPAAGTQGPAASPALWCAGLGQGGQRQSWPWKLLLPLTMAQKRFINRLHPELSVCFSSVP